jgi:hypothetical protein
LINPDQYLIITSIDSNLYIIITSIDPGLWSYICLIDQLVCNFPCFFLVLCILVWLRRTDSDQSLASSPQSIPIPRHLHWLLSLKVHLQHLISIDSFYLYNIIPSIDPNLDIVKLLLHPHLNRSWSI